MPLDSTSPSSDINVPEGCKPYGERNGYVLDQERPGTIMEFSSPSPILSVKKTDGDYPKYKVRIPFKKIKGGKKMHDHLYQVDDLLNEFAKEKKFKFISFFRPTSSKGKLGDRASLVITIPQEIWEEEFPDDTTLETIHDEYKINLNGNYKFGVGYVYENNGETITGINIQPQRRGAESQLGSISFMKIERNSGKRKKEEEAIEE
jgi:hypothetical protein